MSPGDAMPKCEKCGQALPDETDDFAAFWAAWIGLKVDKLSAQRAWKRLTKAQKELVFFDLHRRKGLIDPQFFPRAPAYLNGQRWTDELPTLTIPDPPKPAQPDGGRARIPVRGPDLPVERGISRDEARRRFGDILSSVKVKGL